MNAPQSLYGIPALGRYGLTHGLLAWARCRLWCEQHGAVMLAPFWLKPRIGPYLRRERDKRNYFLLFHQGHALGGLRRLGVLTTGKIVEIGAKWPEVPPEAAAGEKTVLRFHNAVVGNELLSFDQIVRHGPFLQEELVAMTRERYQPAQTPFPFVAIHVRMGDFAKPSGVVATGSTNTRLPVDWYVDRLDALRAALGKEVRAIVFSDGVDEDLAPLIGRPGVERAPKQQSITDLLQMGQGAALIASGSGFSLWGAFLGSVPRIAFPGQSIVPITIDRSRDIESEFGAVVPQNFVEHVSMRVGR